MYNWKRNKCLNNTHQKPNKLEANQHLLKLKTNCQPPEATSSNKMPPEKSLVEHFDRCFLLTPKGDPTGKSEKG
ncbi:hypothetical protein CMK22_04950 [Candidatus Poribacteria bacterium]|nr:hypothetical protein [Candidatus Poribacteria bacterium]